jgi:hypothetical protein
VHAWLVRYRQEGITGPEDRRHQVRHHLWRISAQVEGLICELRRGSPKWGPRRLVFEMDRRGHATLLDPRNSLTSARHSALPGIDYAPHYFSVSSP